eukprot:TRINITY_DN18287_c0_g1_i1.p3 TRINITY_DN18287_c0_g1~~TRINITY_DN18287_c0_g1_i1.p3  ORF type:complete len:109 (-),score=9.31 TRINITY_DN18287_c0_g1_i1:729-1007(-)
MKVTLYCFWRNQEYLFLYLLCFFNQSRKNRCKNYFFVRQNTNLALSFFRCKNDGFVVIKLLYKLLFINQMRKYILNEVIIRVFEKNFLGDFV